MFFLLEQMIIDSQIKNFIFKIWQKCQNKNKNELQTHWEPGSNAVWTL